jgi:hypothetical protein
VFGQSFYDYMAAHPDADQTWNRSMAETEQAWTVGTGTVAAYDRPPRTPSSTWAVATAAPSWLPS